MKLYDLKNKSKIYEECSDGSKYVIFNKIDGAYSHCTTEKKGTVHLSAVTPLVEYKNGYKIKT